MKFSDFICREAIRTNLDAREKRDVIRAMATSLLEAMSCGLFPVLSDIPANREWIAESRDNGILVPLHWPVALGHALSRAIRGRAWRERVAAANRAMVVERADSAANLAMLAEYMERVVTAPDEALAAPAVAIHNAGGAE